MENFDANMFHQIPSKYKSVQSPISLPRVIIDSVGIQNVCAFQLK